MSYFQELDMDMRTVADCQIRTVEQLAYHEARGEQRRREFRAGLNAHAEERRRVLARVKAGLHGDWNSLVSKQAELRRRAVLPGQQFPVRLLEQAHDLQPAIDHVWAAFKDAEAEYEAWQPCYEEE